MTFLDGAFINFQRPDACNYTTYAIGEEGGGIGAITMAYPETGIAPPTDITLPGWQRRSDLTNAIGKIDRYDSGKYNGKLDNQVSVPVFPGIRSEQMNTILNNLYTNVTPKDWVGSAHYQMNEIGKKLAGEDGKISYNELNQLDTNRDGKVSQEELNAYKQNPDQPPVGPTKELAKTKDLISAIINSDTNGDGAVSRSDIVTQYSRINSTIQLLNAFVAIFPSLKERITPVVKNLYNQSISISLVNRNFSAFSRKGHLDLIDHTDITNIKTAANSDGKIADFTDADLTELKKI